MLPHHGAGAGQALEDALMLAKLLGHPQATKSNIQVSSDHRRPRSARVSLFEGAETLAFLIPDVFPST